MRECSSALVLKCFSAQVLKCSSASVLKCFSAQVLQCSSASVLKCFSEYANSSPSGLTRVLLFPHLPKDIG